MTPDTVTHLSTNRARRWLTSLIKANALTTTPDHQPPPGKAKAGMVHSVSGMCRWNWDPLRTRAIPERLRGVFATRRYTNPRLPYLTLPVPLHWLRYRNKWWRYELCAEEGEFVNTSEQGGAASRRRAEADASSEEEIVDSELAVEGERLHRNVGQGEGVGSQQTRRPDGAGSHPSRFSTNATKTSQLL